MKSNDPLVTSSSTHDIPGDDRMTNPPHPLVGQWFHADHMRYWQGEVLGAVTDTVFLVQTYSWGDGGKDFQKLVPVADMLLWRFYDTATEMSDAYRHGGVRERFDRLRGESTCPTCRLPSPGSDHEEACAVRRSKVGTPYDVAPTTGG